MGGMSHGDKVIVAIGCMRYDGFINHEFSFGDIVYIPYLKMNKFFPVNKIYKLGEVNNGAKENRKAKMADKNQKDVQSVYPAKGPNKIFR